MYKKPSSSSSHDASSRLKKLKMRIETDDHQFAGMRKLRLSGKELDLLPEEVFQLNDVEVLVLSPEREACIDFRLQALPRAVGQLVNLRALILDTNDLCEVPAEICDLVQLERLSLSNNSVRVLPEAFGKLRKLTSFHMSNNTLEKLPTTFHELVALRFLDLSSNRLQELPPEIGLLTGLESLVLAYNRLRQLPDSVCDMVGLHMLWIGFNRISRLPAGFGNLRNLDWGTRGHTQSLALDGNPLVSPPIEVCRQGVLAIEAYFAKLKAVKGR